MPTTTVDLESVERAANGSAPSILIVEDEVIVAEDVRRRLEEMGYRVTGVASRGDQALAQVRRLRPDLILMDIGLKGADDGIETARTILGEEDIPIVFASAYSDDATLRRVKMIDPFGFVLKPFDERELRTAIEIGLYKHGTDRKLRQREELYRSLVELSTDAIATLDVKGTITFCNAQKAMIHGEASPEDLIGRAALDLVAERDRAHASAMLARVCRGEPLADDRITFKRKDGTLVIAEVSAMLITGRHGRPMQVMCVEHDITHRVQIEEDLRLVVQQLQFVVDNLNDGIMFEDREGKVRLANASFCRMFGIEAAKASPGTSCADLTRDTSRLMADGASYVRRMAEVRAGATSVTGDVLRLADGGILERDYAPLLVDGIVLAHVWHYHTRP